jgi:hypothetical protein
MNPLSRKPQVYVESTFARLAYIPVMAVTVVAILVFRWPVLAVTDRWLRRAGRKAWGGHGRVIAAFTPGTPWHTTIVESWMPRYGDRTSLVDLAASRSRSLERRIYRRWDVRPPALIAIPAEGRVCTLSFAEALADPVALERRFAEVARIAFGET